MKNTWNRQTNEVKVDGIIIGKADNLISAKKVATKYTESLRK